MQPLSDTFPVPELPLLRLGAVVVLLAVRTAGGGGMSDVARGGINGLGIEEENMLISLLSFGNF